MDGYKIDLKNIANKKLINNEVCNANYANKNLWFVNIEGYDPSSL